MEYPIVEMKGISIRFGQTVANDGVDFSLEPGSIHGLLGENGAGKTTLMNALFGLRTPDEGIIKVDGQEVAIHSPIQARNLKINMVHQHFMLVPTMTVAENVMLGLRLPKYPLLNYQDVKKRIHELSTQFSLEINPDTKIADLSVGQQQRVEIITALYRETRILILDEPTAVLTPQESQELFVILNSLKKRGTAIILISHKLEEVLSAADTITILRNGRKVTTTRLDGCPMHKHELSALMVGRQVLFDFDKSKHTSTQEVVRIEHMSAYNDAGAKALDDVSFSIHKGEIVAIAGVDGNGQKELCEVLSGLRKSHPGEWFLDKEEMSHKTVRERIERGVAYIPEDRKSTGLVMDWGIDDNLILKNYRSKKFSHKYVMKKKEIVKHSSNAISTYNIKCDSPLAPIKKLSGGNQQKVILAREISSSPSFLIASHPTRGLDVGAMEYIRSLLIEQRNNGTPILLISADLDEVFQCADRIIVFYNGRVMGDVPPTESIENIGKMMAGMIDE